MIKGKIARYILFVYNNYIDTDFDVLTKFGKLIIYPAHYIRMFMVILYSIVCFPLVLLHMYYVENLQYKVEVVFELLKEIMN
jgi:hypothetical protein